MFWKPPPPIAASPEIRRAEKRDVARLVELWMALMAVHEKADSRFEVVDATPQIMSQRFHYLMHDRDALVLVSTDGDEVVGFIVGNIDVNLPFFKGTLIGFVADLFVDPDYRRTGRARRMVEALRGWFLARRVSSIQLHAAACNPSAHDFWAQMGFRDYLVRMLADV